MVEDYFASTRNGHELNDFYDRSTNTLDIRSNGLYPSNVLSNLCSNGFRLDGMICGSMEGFLQSLKQKDINKQRQICSMKGDYLIDDRGKNGTSEFEGEWIEFGNNQFPDWNTCIDRTA